MALLDSKFKDVERANVEIYWKYAESFFGLNRYSSQEWRLLLEEAERLVELRKWYSFLVAVMPIIFLFLSIVLLHTFAPDLPSRVKYYVGYFVFLVCLIIFWLPALKKFIHDKEDLRGIQSLLVGSAIIFFWVIHMLSLADSQTFSLIEVFRFFFIVVCPIGFAVMFLTYEILESRQLNRPIYFRAKRIFGRAMLFLICSLGVSLNIELSTFLFGANKPAVYLGLFIFSVVLLVFTSEFEDFFKKIVNGEW